MSLNMNDVNGDNSHRHVTTNHNSRDEEPEENSSEVSQQNPTTSSSPGIKLCRICFESDEGESKLINPCKCSGSQEWVHYSCLKKWIESSGKRKCGVCKSIHEGVMMVEKPASCWQFVTAHPGLINVLFVATSGFLVASHILFIGFVTLRMAKATSTGTIQVILINFFAFLNTLFFAMLILIGFCGIFCLYLVYRTWSLSRLTLKVVGYNKPPEPKEQKKNKNSRKKRTKKNKDDGSQDDDSNLPLTGDLTKERWDEIPLEPSALVLESSPNTVVTINNHHHDPLLHPEDV